MDSNFVLDPVKSVKKKCYYSRIKKEKKKKRKVKKEECSLEETFFFWSLFQNRSNFLHILNWFLFFFNVTYFYRFDFCSTYFYLSCFFFFICIYTYLRVIARSVKVFIFVYLLCRSLQWYHSHRCDRLTRPWKRFRCSSTRKERPAVVQNFRKTNDSLSD